MLILDARNVQWFTLLTMSWLAGIQVLVKARVRPFDFLSFHKFFRQSMVHFRLTAEDCERLKRLTKEWNV